MTTTVRGAPYAGWRALAATVLIMSGAVGAHTWAGGHVPDGSALIALTALVLGGSLLVLRGTAHALVLLPVVAAAQVGLHTSFAMSATDHAGHLDHAEAAATWSWQMLLAHLSVTALTAFVWHLCGRGAALVVSVLRLAPVLAVRRTPRPLAGGAPRVCTPVVLLVAAPRRGPPTALARACASPEAAAERRPHTRSTHQEDAPPCLHVVLSRASPRCPPPPPS